MERKEMEWQREDYRAGVTTSVQYNLWRGADSEPMQPADFFPSLPRWSKKREKRMSSDNIKNVILDFRARRAKQGETRAKA